MELPNIGKPGSILSILIPGTFLLFNLLVFLYILPSFFSENIDLYLQNSEIISIFKESKSLVFIIFLLVACLGYLLGVVLQLLSCRYPDCISGCYLTLCHHVKNFVKNLWPLQPSDESTSDKPARLSNKFPYIEYIGINCNNRYSNKALIFYDDVWKKRRFKNSENKEIENREFFNLCKIILISIDKKLAAECYAAEALNRYISSMFYALFISFILIALVVLILFLQFGKFSIVLMSIAIIYALAEIVIVRRYRYSRLKEANTVFAATFAVKDRIIPLLKETEAIVKEPSAIAQVTVTVKELIVYLADGRSLSIPLEWYPRLVHASPQERQNWEILGDGDAIEWIDLDEHIGIEGLLAGKRSGESQRSFERWLATRNSPARN